jgi:hyperosmotically inducible protein
MLQRCVSLLAAVALIGTVACSRSDPGLTTEVKSKLVVDDVVKAYQIDVDTKDRVVTLSGTVESPAARDQAVILARQTKGVRDVVDRIAVNPDAAVSVSGEVGQATREAREEAGKAVDTTKELGRDAGKTVEHAATRTEAVLTDAAVTSEVKTKLLADAAVSGLSINVDTTDHVVTLSGTVPTKAEAGRAVSLARESAGVTRVIDKLRISR